MICKLQVRSLLSAQQAFGNVAAQNRCGRAARAIRQWPWGLQGLSPVEERCPQVELGPLGVAAEEGGGRDWTSPSWGVYCNPREPVTTLGSSERGAHLLGLIRDVIRDTGYCIPGSLALYRFHPSELYASPGRCPVTGCGRHGEIRMIRKCLQGHVAYTDSTGTEEQLEKHRRALQSNL